MENDAFGGAFFGAVIALVIGFIIMDALINKKIRAAEAVTGFNVGV